MNKKGLTIVEMMIVVAIIALLSAIVIPNLLRTKINANEQAAVTAAKTILSAAKKFASENNGLYPPNLAALGELSHPQYINHNLAQATTVASATSGYYFNYIPVGNPPTGFWISIEPASPNTGVNFYYIDEQGLVCKGVEAAGDHVASGLQCPANFNPVK